MHVEKNCLQKILVRNFSHECVKRWSHVIVRVVSEQAHVYRRQHHAMLDALWVERDCMHH